MVVKMCSFLFSIMSVAMSLNYWSWDCESIEDPVFNGLVTANTSLVTTDPHSGNRCMQIDVTGSGGNNSGGADVSSIDLGPVIQGQSFYYRWWMKLDQNYSWGNGSAYTKASRMKHTDEQITPRLWTGYVADDGVFLHESDVLPNYFANDAIYIKYDFKNAAGKGWHEYIVAMKMQNGNTGKDGEFHFYVDGKLIGSKTGIHYMDYSGNCSEAWRGWMVSPYFQLNGTSSDGGLMWLDDYSMDDQWNSSFKLPLDVPVISQISSVSCTTHQTISIKITASNNPVSFQAQNLPSGIILDTNTGIISGTLTQAGTLQVSVTAKNSVGVSNTMQFNIVTTSPTILLPLAKPQVTSIEFKSSYNDTSILFSDDFETDQALTSKYKEYNSKNNSFVRCDNMGAGLSNYSMVAKYAQSQVDVGSLILTFGKNPIGSTIKPNIDIKDVYWRFYILLENGWQGNPRKLTRATILTSISWQQAMIGHVWGNSNDSVLNIDPATGITPTGSVATTTYNDAANLKWLGKKYGVTPVFSQKYTNTWVCIESHAKLNTPGQQDGIFEFWIDGNLEARTENLNWTGIWDDLGINTLMFENYWNEGAPKPQKIYWDNIVVSTKRIGLAKSPAEPIVTASPVSTGNTNLKAQVSTSRDHSGIVWEGTNTTSTNQIQISKKFGTFNGNHVNASSLNVGIYYVRVCYFNTSTDSSGWSEWKVFEVGQNGVPTDNLQDRSTKRQDIRVSSLKRNNGCISLQLYTNKQNIDPINMSVSIFSANGKLVNSISSNNFLHEESKNTISFRPPSLAPGIYIFAVRTLTETVGTFIINNAKSH